MNRALYFFGGIAVMMSILFVQSVGGIQPPAASDSAQFVAPEPGSAAAPETSSAIDALLAWPAGAGR